MKLTACNPAAKAGTRLAGSPVSLGGIRRFCAVGLSLVLGLAPVLLAVQRGADPAGVLKGVGVRTKEVIVGPQDEPFNMPSDAAVGQDGKLYVLDGVNNRVVVYDAEGSFLFKFGSRGSNAGQFLFPLGISVGPDGKVYVADSGNHRFQAFAPDGKLLESVQLPTTASGVPPDPTDVAADPIRPRLYIADNDNHRLNVYNLTSRSFEEPLGGPGLGERQFRFPFLIDTSADGYVLVVEPINTRVQVLNSAGKFVGFIGGWGIKPGQLFRPKGVATLGKKVFVTDSYLGRVQVFDLGGSFLGMLAGQDGGPIQLAAPMGITVDAANRRLYVVELKANRVCRMDLE